MRSPGHVGPNDEVAVLSRRDANAGTTQGTIVFRVGRDRCLVDARPAVVVEREHGEIATEYLEARHDIAAFGRRDHADICRCLADGKRAHSVGAAQRELFCGSQILGRFLTGERNEHIGAIRQALQPAGIHVVLREVTVGVMPRCLVRLQHRGRCDTKIAIGDRGCVGVQAAAEQSVAEIADYARLGVADLPLLERTGRRIAGDIDELLVLVGELRDEIRVARAQDRMEGVDALHFSFAAGAQVREVLGEPVFEFRVAGAGARAVIADRDEVREARVPHAFVGYEAAKRRLIAVAERRIPVEVGTDAIFAGEAIALVVGIDIAVQATAFLRDVDTQVGRTDRLAGADLRGDLRAGQVVDDQQRSLEARLGDYLPLLEMRAEDACQQILGDMRARAPVELDLSYASFDDADLNPSITYRLLRQIGLGQEIATRAIEGAYLRRRFV